MKNKLLPVIIMLSKYAIYSLTVMCIFSNLILAAEGTAQKYKSVKDVYIYVGFDNATITEVFAEIEKHTNFYFTVDHTQIDQTVVINRKPQSTSVAELLIDLSKKANLKFRQVNDNISVVSRTKSSPLNRLEIEVDEPADIRIKGVVVDEKEEPLVGVSIVVKGTTIGTITDYNGEYFLEVPDENAVLVFSFVGYATQEVPVGNLSVIDVIMEEDIETLSEVVVVGYTEKDSRKLTSSLATVDSDRLEKVPMSTFDNILQGNAAGVLIQSGTGQPGRSASISIRGVKSLNAGDAPLYVLDGTIITEGDFAAINPNDIGSLTILKDAAATQIYGSRASGGVVVITSKEGVKGKTRMEYSTYFGLSLKPDYNDGLQPLTSAQNIDLQHELGSGSTVGFSQRDIDSLKQINTDWLDVTTRNGTIQSHELSLSGGNENTTFYLSGAYFSQEGIALRSDLKRYSLKLNLEHEINNFTIRSNVYLAHTDARDSQSEGSFSRSNSFYGSIRTAPYNPVVHPVTGEYVLGLEGRNIVERTNNTIEDEDSDNAIISLRGEYRFPFLKGLRVVSNWSVNYRQENNVDFVDPQSFRGQTRQGRQGELRNSFDRRTLLTGTNSLHYSFDIANEHFFEVAAYQEYFEAKTRETFVEVFGFDKINTIAGATPGTADNGFIPNFGGGISENTLSSLFGTLDYSFRDKYNVTAGIRRDGSNRFGANNRFGTFYSVGLGWSFSEESFMSGLGVLDYGKFRASYGTVGNQSISNTAAQPIFGISSYGGVNGIVEGLSNPDLKWEQTQKLNLGIDLTLLNDFLSLNVDWYNEVTTDLLISTPLSETTGFSSQLRNTGSLRNRGIEVNVNTNNINKGNFKWSTDFNISRNRTIITELPNGEFVTGNTLVREGVEFPIHFRVKRAGVNPANGRFLWYNLNGELTETFDLNDRVAELPATPRFFGGLTNTLSYKGLTLRVLFTFSEGKYIMNIARTSLDNPTKTNNGSASTNALRLWRQPGDITDIPSARQGEYFSDSGFIEDASFIRLRNVRLSYNLSSSITERLHISGLNVYLQGQNVLTFTSYSGLDPENSGIEERAEYPALQTFTVGADVRF